MIKQTLAARQNSLGMTGWGGYLSALFPRFVLQI